MTRPQRPIDVSQSFCIDVGATNTPNAPAEAIGTRIGAAILDALQRMLTSQERQNQLLEELVKQMSLGQRQRNQELQQWRSAHPQLAVACREAAETLGKVQSDFLGQITEEVRENGEYLSDGEFMLQEFVDRFGPRLAHLNGVLQVLAQLGAPPQPEANSGE